VCLAAGHAKKNLCNPRLFRALTTIRVDEEVTTLL
jgi:hypothetical protein